MRHGDNYLRYLDGKLDQLREEEEAVTPTWRRKAVVAANAVEGQKEAKEDFRMIHLQRVQIRDRSAEVLEERYPHAEDQEDFFHQ